MASFGVIPSALWAGAITPILTTDATVATLQLPSYSNVSLIKEYPSEIRQGGPTLRTTQGYFTYNVGTQLVGDILSSGASATTLDKSVRQHSKLDNTQFSYLGRSYGVGSSVGLGDENIRALELATGYTYQESGYLPEVSCTYNSSTEFIITKDVDQWMWIAGGYLPDSVEDVTVMQTVEYNNYVGHYSDAIVAIGVSHSPLSERRYLAIASGKDYAFLNTTQCSFEFTPTLFNISVNLPNRTIAVTPGQRIPDFNPERNLTRTVVRQFSLLSNDLTNLYVSLLGDSLNSSIAAYNMSMSASNATNTEADATLAGLTNSITAMTDDMLSAYAAAQLMVGQFSESRTAKVNRNALRFGQPAYVYAVFTVNFVVLLAVAAESARTRAWMSLGSFDFLDPRALIVAASRGGGMGVADAVDGMGAGIVPKKEKAKKMWLFSDRDEGIGDVSVRLVTKDGDRFGISLGRGRVSEDELESKVAHVEGGWI
ncbi:uncharacterized protein BDZ99DRAFT_468510 [Mytilinidion resinicola]|uniref:Uncharacterized protein n=1 Tax=Mytilinidion resinicola TaxID=574789 RepID=A0A6A6Y574_9PEZI|nr:uncharacterized protein BDZ99DRAFT_468510 [Mytilinidion resinicola]KAF2803174.1 hypothetical protein BDZ99DRAFT_468510 [Mytilinidion resinicola]